MFANVSDVIHICVLIVNLVLKKKKKLTKINLCGN